MTQIIIITLGLVLLTIFIVAYRLARKHGVSVAEEIVGICEAALEQTARKNENKAKIVALLRERGEMSNSDIRDALSVSSTSVVRYMDELELEGKAEQVGRVGHAVTYKLK